MRPGKAGSSKACWCVVFSGATRRRSGVHAATATLLNVAGYRLPPLGLLVLLGGSLEGLGRAELEDATLVEVVDLGLAEAQTL
jgi:hypothetical protein